MVIYWKQKTLFRVALCAERSIYVCMLVGGKELRRTYPCETERIAKSIEKGLTKHSIYVVESHVYEIDNNDDIVYFESMRPLPIPYNPKKRTFNSSYHKLDRIELDIIDAYKDLIALRKNVLPYSYNNKSYIMELEDINERILFYKRYKSHIQRFAY